MTTEAPSTTSLVNALIDIGTIVDRALEVSLTSLKLSSPQLRILEALYAESDGIQPRNLAAMLIQQPQSVSGLLARLQARGLVQRHHDSDDRRIVWVNITHDGLDVVDASSERRAVLDLWATALLRGGAPTAFAWRDALLTLLTASAH